MPGVKRKAQPSRQAEGTSKAAPSSSSRAASSNSRTQRTSDSEDGQFDDDQDLLAQAMTGNGADESDGSDDGSGHSNLDEPMADAELAERVEGDMQSDEDMEGGFEDLEGADAESAGFEGLEGEEDDNPQEDEPMGGDGGWAGRKKSQSALYAIPSYEEVQGLKETGDLFKSNVFKLQIDELLGEVRPAYQRAGALELVLRRLQGLFGSIPSVSPLPLAKAVEHLKKQSQGSVKIPFADPAPKGDVQYKFAFEKPAAMHLIGSWPLRSAAKRPDGLDVDIAVVMPSTIFQEKDHMNYRYFHKRAYYLAVLAAAIRSAEGPSLGVDPSYQLLDGDARRTVLVLSPVHDRSDTDFSSLKCRIRIHLAHEAGLFPPTRLAPSRNSVRVGGGNAEESSSSLAPTPRYNGAVLLDSLHLAHLVYLHATAKACPAFADACLLLKTWAFQRGFGSGTRDKFRSSSQSRAGSRRRLVAGTGSARFLLTMVLAHLLNGEEKVPGKASTNRSKLANGFSSYQLFRGVVDWLGTHDFVAQPVFMKAPVNASVVSNGGKFAREDFAAQFERVFVDPTGSVNLLSSMPASGLELLQQEARQTFAMLNDAETDHFGALFLQDRSAPFFAFDETALVQFPLNKDDAQKNEPAAATRRADFGSILHIVTHDASATVTKALGTRAKLATLLTYASEPSLMTWPLDASRPGADGQLELGITLDPEHAHRLVDHGPTAEDTAGAEKFRAFWGPLAELRRFRDGRIMESVVWEIRGPFDRPAIPRRLVRHILSRHHGVSDEQISFFAEPFAGLVDVHPSLVDRTYLASPAEKGFQLIQAAYDDLARQLRSIEDLPLSLINVRPCSAGLRQTSTFVTGSLNLEGLGTRVPDVASYLPVQDIVLTFESSGRWPDDLAAIQKMKVAFYEKLCVSLSTKLQGARASVVYDLDAGASDIQDEAALELVLPTGFAFRARIHHDRERVLLERIVADKRAETPSRRRTAQAALQRWLRRFVLLPQHHAAIATLQHRFVALSLTIRLVKRWLAAQMLSPHLPEELIELICVATFLSPETGPPSSGPAGFVRVLQLLSTWRWREDALVVPLFSAAGAPEGGESVRFPTDKRAEALEAFTLARKTDPALNHRAWFVVTEEDTQGTAWGRDAPFAGAADGVTGLAKAACALLDVGPRLGEVEIKSLFTPPLSHYDFLIHLSPSILPRYVEAVLASPSSWSASPPSSSASKKYKNHPDSSADLMLPSVLGSQPRAGFDPATEFVGLLTALFSDTFRLFHDIHGGTVIGGIFNPSLLRPRDFKVALGFSSRPSQAGLTSGASSTTGEEKEKDGQKGVEKKGKGKKGSKTVELNTAAVIAEIGRLGTGLVSKVELRNAA